MKLDSFKHLYLEELRELCDAEDQLLRALPNLAESAVLPELREALADQLSQTQVHRQRLEAILQSLGVDPTGCECPAMAALIEEANQLVREERKADPGVLDAALLAADQKIVHFGIAAYGCARTHGEMLGERQAVPLLQKCLEDESELDQHLTQLALRSVNLEAVEATDPDPPLSEAVVSALDAAAHVGSVEEKG